MRQLSTRVAYETPWIRVREDEIEWSSGHRGTYSVVERNDYATVLPRENGGFWLVEQYRYTIDRRVWEFPQGGWPHGSAGGSGLELAAAELREETGLRAASIVPLGRLQESYGFVRQAVEIFLAEGLTAGEPEREITEQDMVHAWFSDAEIVRMITDGRIVDSTVLAALALYRLHADAARS